MTLAALTEPFVWYRYSKKLAQRCTTFYSAGSFSAEEAKERGFLFVSGRSGERRSGNCVEFFFLVNPEDGVIVDVRFSAFGMSALIGCAEAACEWMVKKPCRKAFACDFEALDSYLRDRNDIPAIPMSVRPFVRLIVEAIEEAALQSETLPLKEGCEVVAKRLSSKKDNPEFDALSDAKKLVLINEVLDEEIRPFVAMDGGGVDVLSVTGNDVSITYSGNCVGCFSATGSTLNAMQEILNERLSSSIRVVPILADNPI